MSINQIHTNCKDCVFAQYSNGKPIDCSAGRLDIYRETGAEILQAYDDDNNEFFVINNRICVYHREKEWAKQFSSSELINIVESQIKSPYALIVNYDKNSSIEDLEVTLQSVSQQYNTPTYLAINNWADTNVYETNILIENCIKDSKLDGTTSNWSIKTILDSSISNRSAIDLAFDMFKNKSNFHYYLYVNAGIELPKKLTAEIHESIFDHGKKPLFCNGIDENDNFMLTNFIMHKKHAGNSFSIKLEDKMLEFEEGIKEFIYDIEEICPSLK